MSKGIVWITTTWVRHMEDPMKWLRPLEEEAGLEVRLDSQGRDLTEAEVRAGLPGVVVAIPSNDPYNERTLPAGDSLKIIARTGVGVNSIDLKAATAHGVLVTNAVGKNANSVAEHTFGLMLGAARRIPELDRKVREGLWGEVRRPCASLIGRTIGILGLGNVGKQVARRAAAFGMNIIAYDPVRDERFAAEVGVFFRTLEEVLETADFICCHLPLLPETEGLIGKKLISRMKPTAYLINCARGPIVNLDDLADALARGAIRGAALDVFPEEPPDVKHPIFALENVTLAPHTGGIGEDACENCLRHSVQCVLDYLGGRVPADVVNPEVLKAMKN